MSTSNFARLLALGFAMVATPLVHAGDGELDPAYGSGGKTALAWGGVQDGSVRDLRAATLSSFGPAVLETVVWSYFDTTDHTGVILRFDTGGVTSAVSLDETQLGGLINTGSAARAWPVNGGSNVIYLGASVSSAAGDLNYLVCRLVRNGGGALVLDPLFAGDGCREIAIDRGSTADHRDDFFYDFAVDGNGRVVVVGDADGDNGNRAAVVVRLDTQGGNDAGFNGGNPLAFQFARKPSSAVRVAIDANSRIVVAGAQQFTAPYGFNFAAARLLDDGSFDAGFNGSGVRVMAFDKVANGADLVTGMALGRNGEVLLAGVSQTGASTLVPAVAKLDAAGQYVAAYGNEGGVFFDYGHPGLVPEDAAPGADGSLYLTGAGPAGADIEVLRVGPRGRLLCPFGNTAGCASSITLAGSDSHYSRAIAIDGASRIWVGGERTNSTTADTDAAMARLQGDRIFTDGLE